MMSTVARAAVGLLVVLAMIAPAGAQKQKPRSTAPVPPARRAARPAAPQAAQPAAVQADRNVPFEPGETLTYDVSWSTYLTAGVATLTVKDKRAAGQSSAYYIVAEGRPTGILSSLYSLYYKLDTMLDSRLLLPLRGSVYSQEGSRRRTRVTVFDHAALRADYEVRTTTDVKSSVGLARYSQDILSAVYALRAVPLKENSRLTMPVCDGGKMYLVQFNIGKIEPVMVGASSISTFRMTPTITDTKGAVVGRPAMLWMSTDGRHLPVKLRVDLAVGSINMLLRDAGR
ncbi:MAG TPA: DUF3108 domain-containing protein [Vicinamibacterales bacterium]